MDRPALRPGPVIKGNDCEDTPLHRRTVAGVEAGDYIARALVSVRKVAIAPAGPPGGVALMFAQVDRAGAGAGGAEGVDDNMLHGVGYRRARDRATLKPWASPGIPCLTKLPEVWAGARDGTTRLMQARKG